MADLWWTEEYEPAIRVLRDEHLIAELVEHDAGLTDTEAYLRFSAQRYRLLRTHEWSERAVERVREAPPSAAQGPSQRRVRRRG
jgi:hypothetical protein